MKLEVVGLLFIVGKVVSANVRGERTVPDYPLPGNTSTAPSLQPGHLKGKLKFLRVLRAQPWRYLDEPPFKFSLKTKDIAASSEFSAEIIKDKLQYRKEFPGQERQYGRIIPVASPLGNVRKSTVSASKIKAQIIQDNKLQYMKEFPGQEWQYDSSLPIEFPLKRVPKTTNSTETAQPNLEQRSRRIFNPDETSTVEDYPFMAALLVNKELWCGAVIITRDKVLTAAHCLQLQYNNRFFREYAKMLSVRVGSSNATFGGDLLRVSEIMFHPNYRPQSLAFNFALLKLHKNMTFGKEQVRAEAVPFSRSRTVAVDTELQFLGWGSMMSTGGGGGQALLQRLRLPIYDLTDCQRVYGRELVTRNNFCAGYITLPKNVCNHDAGGPAIMDGVLIGILSFSSKRCDQTDRPAVFSTVGAVADWLEGLID